MKLTCGNCKQQFLSDILSRIMHRLYLLEISLDFTEDYVNTKLRQDLSSFNTNFQYDEPAFAKILEDLRSAFLHVPVWPWRRPEICLQ